LDARQRRFALLSLVNHDANAGRLERRRGQPRPRTHPTNPSNPSIVEPVTRTARRLEKAVGLGSSFPTAGGSGRAPVDRAMSVRDRRSCCPASRARRPCRARRRRCRISHTPPRVAFRDRSTTGICRFLVYPFFCLRSRCRCFFNLLARPGVARHRAAARDSHPLHRRWGSARCRCRPCERPYPLSLWAPFSANLTHLDPPVSRQAHIDAELVWVGAVRSAVL
jgi:hypothetical protein